MARAPDRDDFLNDVLDGLNGRPRTLPCKYFYDQRGSELFEAICECPEYYVTRADLALHEAHLDEISAMIGPDAHIIEFGSGAGIKTHKLLASLNSPRAYTPIEISESALAASARELEEEFPDIEIRPLQADYTQDIDADRLNLEPASRRRVIYFPGSTIGNFDHAEALAFLRRMGRMARSHGAILIGVDLLKPAERLIAAYDDAQGTTAAFNLNLLQRMQRELGAEIEIDAFAHESRFNQEESRIEMHLVARRPTCLRVGGQEFEFKAGESIHTESSHKYSVADFQELARRAGLIPVEVWTDPDALFSMHWIEAP
jgi:dimethylhistidine N-methyltransferase